MVKTKNIITAFFESSASVMTGVILLVVSIGAVSLPNLFADTSYCNRGDSLSGSTCTHKTTYQAGYKDSYPSCNSGDSLNGSTCTHSYPAQDSVSYTCSNGGTRSGTTCTRTYSACPDGTAPYTGTNSSLKGYCVEKDTKADPVNGKCPSGVYYSSGSCYSRHAAYCNSGDSRSGYTCTNHYTAGTINNYSCNNGDSRSGTTCYHAYTATTVAGYYYCNSGDSRSGSTCIHTTTYAAHKSSGSNSSAAGTSSGQSAAAGPPATPANFAANIESTEVVSLSWSPEDGADHYQLDRSTDNATWQSLKTFTGVNYNDTHTDFNTTYYYRLRAVGADGQTSGYATTQATTNSFSGTSSTIHSTDKIVTVTVPNSAFTQTVNCTVNSDADSLANVPKGESALSGPYDLLCVGADGSVINNFKQPLTVTMKLASVVGGYHNLVVDSIGNNGSLKSIRATYDAKKQQATFKLMTPTSFVVLGQKQSSAAGTVIGVIVSLLLIAAIVGLIVYLRRRPAPAPAPVIATGAATLTAEEAFQKALAQPDCSHLGMAQQVIPASQGCQECLAQGTHWNGLRICLICGHVGCSDDSPEQHAYKHFQSTGHPLIYDFGDPNGNNIGWCYIDQTYI